MAISYFGTPVAALSTFATFWATGGDLSISKVFSGLALLQVLRVAMGRQFTIALELYSEVREL
jgi:hypothetical protein